MHIPRPGRVYAFDNTRRIKVGRTKRSVLERMRECQTGSDEDLTLLASWWSRDHVQLEKDMHDLLAQYRYKREWFDVTFAQVLAAYETINGSDFQYLKARARGGVMVRWMRVRRFCFRACAAIGAGVVGVGVVWLAVLFGLNIV